MLAPERAAMVALQFLEEFAPRREQSAADYHFPQYSDQSGVVLTAAEDAIGHCVDHRSESQSLYFRNLGDGPAHAMLFFTEDGGLILGLSVQDHADVALARLREYARSEIGYATFEEPPPVTVTEFKRLAQTRS
ncbi:MAG: hypothetical protein J2P46_10745 [Zavarzinella sp.]|nr:hypothetical protein [Zavarzinella sp.]